MHPRPTPALLAAATAAVLLLSGCGGGTDATASEGHGGHSSASSDGPQVLQPGKPGEAARTLSPDEASKAAPEAEWSHADVAFLQMMIPHHGQALEMSELVPSRSRNADVRRLADRIRGAQGPEIATMASWLADRDLEVPRKSDDPSAYDHGEHGHTAMAGMLTDAQMAQLRSARGRAFDRLFLAGMIRHHEGAVQMAQETSGEGTDLLAGEMRDEVVATQTAEISRMRQLLQEI